MSRLSSKSIATILVNWNGWLDTRDCLESLLPTLKPTDQVIVCDNASSDDSVKLLVQWAKECSLAPEFIVYDRHEAELGGKPDDPQLIIINSGENLGFAGGNNVGIRYALKKKHSFIWLLNNDTTVSERSASALIDYMDQNPTVGICGSTIYYYDQPKKVQCLGGSKFNFDKAIGTPIGYNLLPHEWPSNSYVNEQIDYISGASMMIRRDLLTSVGLMNEEYFLYFEEIDWSVRLKDKYRLAWAPDSYIWHKEGGSIGSSHRHRPSNLSLHYLCKNRLKFTNKYFPELLPKLRKEMWREALVYIKRLDWQAFNIYIKTLLSEKKSTS